MSLPPVEIPLGAMRFNSDSNKLEYWNGGAWFQLKTFSPNLATSSDTQGVGARALYMGGLKNQQPSPATTAEIDYYNISSQGNAQDFGDLTFNSYSLQTGSMASRTRAFTAGGSPNPGVNTINRCTFSSTGSAVDFGDRTVKSYFHGSHSNATRGIFMGGYVHPNWNDTIDYITMTHDGNAVDFGNMVSSTGNGACGGNPTRALQFGGVNHQTDIQKVQITTLGNAETFGDLKEGIHGAPGAVSNSTRIIIAGGNGHPSPSKRNDIDLYLTASGGTPLHFGELSASKSYGIGGAGDEVRGTFAGGYTPTQINVIEYVSLLSGGLAVDFGDLSNVVRGGGSASNAHGGL